MRIFRIENRSRWGIASGILAAVLLAYLIYTLHAQRVALKNETSRLADAEKNLTEAEHNAESLSDALSAEKQKSGFLSEQASTFAAAIQRMTGTMTVLEKRSKLDPELLIKYSKVYFLNEHYAPSALSQIPLADVNGGKEEYFHKEALPHLADLLKAAKDAGDELQIISAYRSFETQSDLKSKYKITYGIGANKFSAEQGYSEHQLGTAVDFTTPKLGASFEKFDTTSGFAWLNDNAYKFGFILSYPKANAYYVYEPWHWRFVGVSLATKLHDENKRFYDMDQREINEYLVKIFD